jgi:Zn-dependent peptidase ImmA (M78 family)/transcriptional regulator with XRE-family HTH domain
MSRRGVENFVAERLVDARRVRGFSQTALAELLNMRSVSAISRWESGDQNPEFAALDALASALNLPAQFFLSAPETTASEAIFYRSLAATAKSARERAMVRAIWSIEIVHALEQVVDLPKTKVPDLLGARDPRLISDADIEAMATELRRMWGLGDGPISDLHLLLENNGIVVVHDAGISDHMDGLSMWDAEQRRPIVYICVDKPSAVRCRFNAAHELAHLVLHRTIDRNRLYQKAEFAEIEAQANKFASAFLLPASTFTRELSFPTLDGLLSLKRRWRVSVAAMIQRCLSLGIVDPYTQQNLYKHYSSRGWRRSEPLDQELEFEQPRLLARSIMLLRDQGVWTLDELAMRLPFSGADIEQLASLPTGYLGDRYATIALPRLKSDIEASDDNVIELDLFRRREE